MPQNKLHTVVLTLVISVLCRSVSETRAPIIGIFAQPVDRDETRQYIAASYVKWIEAAGGRVVPIRYDANESEIDVVFKYTNGVLFPGGDVPFSSASERMFNLALFANAEGDYYPLWGTCNGFEWLLQFSGGTLDSGFDSENISLPLTFKQATSRMYTEEMMELAKDNITMNNHVQGMTPKNFYSNARLTSFWDVLTTSSDRKGREFLSSIQAKSYPFYGTQFHPEKSQFEFARRHGRFVEAISHTDAAVRLSSALAQFFVEETRKNSHAFPPAEEGNALIWHYPVAFTGPGSVVNSSSFVEEYRFD